MVKSKLTAVQILLDDPVKRRVDNYRRKLEDMPPRGPAARELMLIGLQIVEAEEAAQAEAEDAS